MVERGGVQTGRALDHVVPVSGHGQEVRQRRAELSGVVDTPAPGPSGGVGEQHGVPAGRREGVRHAHQGAGHVVRGHPGPYPVEIRAHDPVRGPHQFGQFGPHRAGDVVDVPARQSPGPERCDRPGGGLLDRLVRQQHPIRPADPPVGAPAGGHDVDRRGGVTGVGAPDDGGRGDEPGAGPVQPGGQREQVPAGVGEQEVEVLRGHRSAT